jgi:hypothetical protein
MITSKEWMQRNQRDEPCNAVSVATGDNGNRLIFEMWWNLFYDLFSVKNVADVNNIDSFVPF